MRRRARPFQLKMILPGSLILNFSKFFLDFFVTNGFFGRLYIMREDI